MRRLIERGVQHHIDHLEGEALDYADHLLEMVIQADEIFGPGTYVFWHDLDDVELEYRHRFRGYVEDISEAEWVELDAAVMGAVAQLQRQEQLERRAREWA